METHFMSLALMLRVKVRVSYLSGATSKISVSLTKPINVLAF